MRYSKLGAFIIIISYYKYDTVILRTAPWRILLKSEGVYLVATKSGDVPSIYWVEISDVRDLAIWILNVLLGTGYSCR